ncbi:L-threonylcarbamoyladenylate synthase [Enterococcus sp. HY326]|uniref:L-threonylcarbamoyladenylate synthase n=1 Tax=Enterococcus sp. HY326 TaxID=2971265 RepID=UPI00223F5071|nr:L-threonylcarbamoyladenylate synthase [Enterococcus sp. HY326]
METKIFTEESIDEAAEILKNGGLIAFPTETVYGLGANGLMTEAVQQVFTVKGRPADNPLILHVNQFSMVENFVDKFHPLTEKIVAKFWPGPLTLIFAVKHGSLPLNVTGGLSTAAFRMPANEKTLLLIEKTGVPLVGPSANTSGKPSPTTAAHVFHDMKGKIAGILDDGPTAIGVESTVLDLSDPSKPPMILRPGAVTKEALENILETEILIDQHLVTEGETPKAPGMKYKHYAPNAEVRMVRQAEWPEAARWSENQKVGVIASPEILKLFPQEIEKYSLADNSIEAATRGLFAGLRALDETGVSLILAPAFEEAGLAVAYMNRLKKASNQKFWKN